MRVIVTGGAGYIGGETVLKLLDAGHSVYAIDRTVPEELLLESGATWCTGDFSGEVALESIKKFNPDAIIHCAGTSLVGPSIANPEEYYDNNFVKTKIMLDYIVKHKLTNIRIIFSSSAATYGNPVMTPVNEVDPADPISPYGQSKLMVDWMLQSYQRAYDLDFVSFRYFNACGADSQARHGQPAGATHIIARVLESIKNGTNFTLYGTDYPTDDGTCVRDYIHVDDIARAHVMAIDSSVPSGVYNLGTNTGHSNKEIVTLAEKVTGKKVNLITGPARSGDPAVLTASADKFNNLTGWIPQYDIEEIITHGWNWYNK